MLALGAVASSAVAQGNSLTLEQAIALARERNGIVRSAILDVEASRSRVAQSFSAFLPTVTPSYRYDNDRFENEVGGVTNVTKTNEGSTFLSASWLLLDSGQRDLSLRASRRGLSQRMSDAKQTLRETLFAVHQQYFNALRAQELLRVQEASVERAQEILKFTDAQIELKIAPRKDRLQANADLLNAQVSRLAARNQVSNSAATLKATLGVPANEPMPALQPIAEPPAPQDLPELAAAITQGMSAREDLRSRRFSIEAQRFNVQRSNREAGITWTLEADYSRQFSERESDRRTLTFLASYPLFDGNRRREAAREQRLGLESLEASYLQSERQAAAEIESAYLELAQNRERLIAATAALAAARENFNAASEAQRAGAEGTNVITTLTAKISLVTAESNYVEAVYDTYISEVRYRLATGQPLLGETP